ncbi:MAG: putative RND superfamily exporter protein [Gammaproteobacteria bacterium]|jgi:predicted RND superfamily exporter protein
MTQANGSRFLRALDYAFTRVASWCARNGLLVLLASLAITGAGLYFAAQTRTDSGLSTFFNDEDPTFTYYLDYQREFNSDEIIYLLYRAPGIEYGPFDLEVMNTIARLTAAIEYEVPFVRKVTSLANVEFVKATDDLIVIHDLVFDAPYTQADLVELQKIALSKPLYLNNLIDPSGVYGAIVVDMTKTSADDIVDLRLDQNAGDGMENLYPYAAASALDNILRRPEYAGVEFWRSGDVPLNADYNALVQNETPIITLLTLGLIALLSLLLFPTRITGLIGPFIVVIVAIILTLAFIGLMGWQIGLLFMMVPTLICAIGVSQTIHVLLAYHRARLSMSSAKAAEHAIREVGAACFLAALTTAIGMLGMSTSALQSISELGVYSAFGVLASFVLSITLMVSLATFSRHRLPTTVSATPELRSSVFESSLNRIVALNVKHPQRVIGVSIGLFVIALVGIERLQIDYNFLEELKPHVASRQQVEKAEEVMGGWVSAVYVFDTGQRDGIASLDLLKLIEQFAAFAESQPLVKKTQHIVEIVKDLNRALHGDEQSSYALPQSREALAQLLFLYQMSGGEEINDFINFDSSQTVIQLRIKIANASQIRGTIAKLDTFIDDHPVAGVAVRKSGIGVLWGKIADYISSSQLKGYALVFSMIFLFMWLAFSNLKLAMLAMIANLAPIMIVLGYMGFVGIKLDYFRLLLATIAMGIAVDDTIHLVLRYRTEFARLGAYRAALDQALHGVGPALITTTLILMGAFMSYLISDMAVLSSFGILLAASVFVALIADLFLLPALILRFKPFGPER